MLRCDRQTKPGLVALYDIRPGNGAGPFLQPRSPHRAVWDAYWLLSAHTENFLFEQYSILTRTTEITAG